MLQLLFNFFFSGLPLHFTPLLHFPHSKFHFGQSHSQYPKLPRLIVSYQNRPTDGLWYYLQWHGVSTNLVDGWLFTFEDLDDECVLFWFTRYFALSMAIFFEGFVHWTHWTSNLFYHFSMDSKKILA